MKISEARADLLSELHRMFKESGDVSSDIDLAAWLNCWIKEPLLELGGATPVRALRTASGRRQVKLLLERMRGGLPA
jgi:Protein of unknown function (DUF2384)